MAMFRALLAVSLLVTLSEAHNTRLTYVLKRPPAGDAVGTPSDLVSRTAAYLSFPGADAVPPSCLSDGSACSLRSSGHSITAIAGSGPDHHATLSVVSEDAGDDGARWALVDLVSLCLHVDLYGDEAAVPPSFSVSSPSAPDDDLAELLRAPSPKVLLGRSGPDQVWVDGAGVRRAYHHGRLVASCAYDAGTAACTPSDADFIHAEAETHPALVSHTRPERVLFVGPAPYLAVREVLKHASVREIVVVGYAGEVLFEKWMGQAYVTGDEEGVRFVGGTAEEFLRAGATKVRGLKFGTPETDAVYGKAARELGFDVIFLHVPHTDRTGRMHGTYKNWLKYGQFHFDVEEMLYQDGKGDEKDGIVVLNVGSEPGLDGVERGDVETGRSRLLRSFYTQREDIQYTPIMVYDEPLAAPYDTSFVLLFSDWPHSHTRFVRQNSGAITLDLASRLKPPAQVGALPTKFYDGTTHKTYQRPSRAWEEWHCNTTPFRDRPLCQIYRFQIFDPDGNSRDTEVVVDAVKGRTLKATRAIPKGKFINLEDAATSLFIDYDEWDLLHSFIEMYPDALMYSELRDFVEAYGYQASTTSRAGWAVSIANVNTFVNHGCTEEETNGTHLPSWNEMNFSPLLARHMELLMVSQIAKRDIEPGEEILQNYQNFREPGNTVYKEFVKNMCKTKKGLVEVSGVEDTHDEL